MESMSKGRKGLRVLEEHEENQGSWYLVHKRLER